MNVCHLQLTTIYTQLHLIKSKQIHQRTKFLTKIHSQMKKEIHTLTVGQFTGLKDKNGDDIYEGDVIELVNGETVEVSFKSGKFVGIRKNGTVSLTSFYWIYAKIVGNVYETVSA